MLKGKAESLEEDPAHNIRQDVKAPTVIRLRQFIRVPYRDIPLTRKNIFQRDANIVNIVVRKIKSFQLIMYYLEVKVEQIIGKMLLLPVFNAM